MGPLRRLIGSLCVYNPLGDLLGSLPTSKHTPQSLPGAFQSLLGDPKISFGLPQTLPEQMLI